MRTRSVAVLVLTLLASLLPATGWTGTLTSEMVADTDATFRFNGKPIHPAIIQQFESWVSDPGQPTTVTVDVAAAGDTNRYSDADVSVDKYQIISYKHNYSSYAYRWEGRLKNGAHVVRTWNAQKGGTAVFQTLFFLRFAEGKGYLADGKPYDRLLLTCERAYPLGDRSRVDVQLKNNEVSLKIKLFPNGKQSHVVLRSATQ